MSDDNWGKCPHGRIGLCYACNPEPFEDATDLQIKLSAAEKERDDLKKRLAGIKDRVLAGSTSGVFWREEIIKIIEEAE